MRVIPKYLLPTIIDLLLFTFLVYTVTMQAQRAAPPDMQCKDKFLIQSTIIPFGSTEEDITSDMVRFMVTFLIRLLLI